MTTPRGRRSAPTQQGPPPGPVLRRVPTGKVPSHAWFREHQRRQGPDGGCWYYATLPGDPSHESGRFDLPAPEGTCYFADTATVATMERVGRFTTKHKPVPGDFMAGRVVTEIVAGHLPSAAANLTSRKVSAVGVTGELFTMSDYSVPQQWALALRAIGHDGIHYNPRFSPGGRAIACFGKSGPSPQPVVGHTPLRTVLTRAGVTVADIPPSDTLNIIDP